MIDASVTIGRETRIEPTAIIQENCSIGDNCFVGHYVVMRPGTKVGNNTVIGHHCVFEGDSTIGSYCLIGAQCHLTKGIVIENKVFMGPGVITSNDKPMVHLRRHIKPFIMQAPVIRHAVRIGVGVLIGPGVEIGHNAVIGMGAIIVKDVLPATIVYGNYSTIKSYVPKEEWLDAD
jgi:UDP-2-acetamido-3-amino-2,3-dideoxy-glucuronate N-acetyltransferase